MCLLADTPSALANPEPSLRFKFLCNSIPVILSRRKNRLKQKCWFQFSPEITDPHPHGSCSHAPNKAIPMYPVKAAINKVDSHKPKVLQIELMSNNTTAISNTGKV